MARWPTWQQKQAQFRRFGYEPSPLQARAHQLLDWRLRLPQVVQVLGGERAGKSTVAGYEAATLVPWSDLIFIAGQTYENCEPEFLNVEQAIRSVGNLAAPPIKPKQGQWQLFTATGCEVRTLSFQRGGPDALIATGKAPDVIVLCEAGLLEFSHFQAAFGRSAEKRGAIIASGTLKAAKPWYAEKYNQFQGANPYNGHAISLPSWGNLAIYPGGEQDPVILALKAANDDLTFRERFGAEPVPSGLLVFGRQFSHELHVKRAEYDPELPVEVAVDPGYAGAYAVEVVQWSGSSDVRVIDEFYAQYATWDQAVAWVKALPYADAIKKGVGDVAIHQHHADRSQYEHWRGEGILLNSRPVSIEDGIGRTRDFLRSPFTGTPRIVYDPRCKGAVWEYGREMYRADQDGEPLKENPVDRYNHARKAVSYWLIWHFGRSDTGERKPPDEPGDYWKRARR